MNDKQILVIDVNRYAAGYIKDLLLYFGYNVECAHSWEEARQYVSRKKYDLLLFDECMVHRGLGTPISWLRENGHDVPVLIMSDIALNELWMGCLELGTVELVNKPISPSTLKFMVEMVLKKYTRAMPVINLTRNNAPSRQASSSHAA